MNILYLPKTEQAEKLILSNSEPLVRGLAVRDYNGTNR